MGSKFVLYESGRNLRREGAGQKWFCPFFMLAVLAALRNNPEQTTH
jgi:hypothetical protein